MNSEQSTKSATPAQKPNPFDTIDVLRPTLLVTWALPAERVRERVPAPLQLDTLRAPDGTELALLSVAAVRNVDAHLAILPFPKFTFEQANYRTYVKHEGRAGVYFFGNFVNSRVALLPPLVFTRNAFYAKARLKYAWARREGKPVGWRTRFDMTSALGQTHFDASGDFVPPVVPLLGADAKASLLITHRLDGYYAARSGGVGLLKVRHLEMEPWRGKLREIRADPWIKWGLLSAEEVAAPLAVMLQHEVLFAAELPQRVG